MSHALGRGLLRSLRAHVNHEVAELVRDNRALRNARYGFLRRLLRRSNIAASLAVLLCGYLVILSLTVTAEWALTRYRPDLLPGYTGEFIKGYIKDSTSYLMAGQIGILAVVSVAVAVVTLLSQRDDGSSLNGDIRLYYSESLSYDLVTSGVALSIVLVIQMFWPSQHFLHVLKLGGADLSFKLFLTATHGAWFIFNLVLFLQFLITTLLFVEPSSRERLRESFSASEVIPCDVANRLLTAIYLNLSQTLLGQNALKEGPFVTFGHGLLTDADALTEIDVDFKRLSRLRDVWVLPLGIAVRSWVRRTKHAQGQSRKRFGFAEWDGQLAILSNFTDVEEGRSDLVLRQGGVPLSFWEKLLIRHSLRFSRVRRTDLTQPTPANFVELLANKVVGQIQISAQTGYESALSELVRYHTFVLAVQNTRDISGKPFNFAQIGGQFRTPDADLIDEYRRIIATAVDKIGTDNFFINRLASLPARLITREAPEFPPQVIKTILDLGIYEISLLEAWVTRRALLATEGEGEPAALAGSDKRAYEDVIINFVSSWETVEKVLISAYEVRRRRSRVVPDDWARHGLSWSALQAHLYHAAYFLSAAIWNADDLGAARYRDLLLRWLQPFYAHLQDAYAFQRAYLLTPDLLSQSWDVAKETAARTMLYADPNRAAPPTTFGAILREAHNDVVCLCGAIALHWYAARYQPEDGAAKAARLTLERQKLASGGSDLLSAGSPPPKSVFRLTFDLILRYAFGSRYNDASYSSTLDGLIRSLNGMSSPRMIPGRVYSGFGLDGFETLRPALVAILAASLSDRSGAEALETVKHLVANEPAYQADRALRDLIYSFEHYRNALGDGLDLGFFERAVRVFGPDLDVEQRRQQLKAIFEAIVVALHAERATRLEAAPLDEAKLDLVRSRITEAVLAYGPDIYCFTQIRVSVRPPSEDPKQGSKFGVIDKGAFLTPPMSALDFDELAGTIVEIARDHLANFVWQDMSVREKREIAADFSAGTSAFWRAVVDTAREVGPEPMILVPLSPLGEEISFAAEPAFSRPIEGFAVTRVQGMPSGGGTGYMGTIEGVHVYSGHGLSGDAIMCSRLSLREITYESIKGSSIIDFEFIDGDDLERSWVRLRFSQKTSWSDDPVIVFKLGSGSEAL